MAANPLMRESRTATPSDPSERQRFWIERGNRILWGEEPVAQGEYLSPRPGLHWVCINGNYSIESRR